MKRVHLSFDLNYSEMSSICFSGEVLLLFIIFITGEKDKEAINRQMLSSMLLKSILAHLYNDSVKSK